MLDRVVGGWDSDFSLVPRRLGEPAVSKSSFLERWKKWPIRVCDFAQWQIFFPYVFPLIISFSRKDGFEPYKVRRAITRHEGRPLSYNSDHEIAGGHERVQRMKSWRFAWSRGKNWRPLETQANPSLVHIYLNISLADKKNTHVCTVYNNVLKPSHVDKWLNQANCGIITTQFSYGENIWGPLSQSFLRLLSNNALFLTADTESYNRPF